MKLAATSGLRWGEQHALTPEDLVLDGPAPCIRVERQLLIGTNGSVIGTALPKMWKPRTALLDPGLVEALRRRCQEVGPGALLFPSPMDPSRPYEPDSFGTSVRRYAPDAGWPIDPQTGLLVWTWHSLRHLAATWQLIEVGIDPVLVSRGLGHKSVAFTLARYVGTTEESMARAAEGIRAWSRRSSRPTS